MNIVFVATEAKPNKILKDHLHYHTDNMRKPKPNQNDAVVNKRQKRWYFSTCR